MTKKVKKEVQIVLTQTIPDLGKIGSLVIVRSGYARNYLIPQQKGELATPEAVQSLETQQKELEAKEKANIEQCLKNKSTLEQIGQFIIQKRIGEDNKIFGKITVKQVRDLIESKTNMNLNNATIEIPEIKELGTFSMTIILATTVKADLKIQILPQ
jgi:large subunit ribosomal protein L9